MRLRHDWVDRIAGQRQFVNRAAGIDWTTCPFAGIAPEEQLEPTALPESIGTLKELRQIDLRGNPIRSLPESTVALPRLEKIDLRWVTTLELDKDWIARMESRGCVVYQ